MKGLNKLTTILVGVAVVAFGSAYYFFSQYSDLKANPNRLAQEETAEVVAKVSKLLVLPEGEEPTVVTVSDPEALQSQPFFAKAKKGDKVLLYANARKAILYDQENHKIVEVAPINIGPSETPRLAPRPSSSDDE